MTRYRGPRTVISWLSRCSAPCRWTGTAGSRPGTGSCCPRSSSTAATACLPSGWPTRSGASTPPASWAKVVQGSVLRLRRSLGHDAIQTTTNGYRLALGDDEIDIRLFERLVARGRKLSERGEHGRAGVAYTQALDLWRGEPLTDLEHWPDGRAEALRLDELRRGTEEALIGARLAAGEDVVADASALVGTGTLSEHRWWLLAMALYRAGRQSEALDTVRRARRTLQEELGLDPGRDLTELEQAILQHAPHLQRPQPEAVAEHARCPWKGLLVYDRDDAEWFFGRDAEVRECLRALRDSPLLVVAGPSGCGKSSMVRAGLVPALVAAGDAVTVLTPGTDPAPSLVCGLSPSSRRLAVLVVDQLEELFTAGHPVAAVDAFLDRLVALAHSAAAASSPSYARTRSAACPPRPAWPGWPSAGCTS